MKTLIPFLIVILFANTSFGQQQSKFKKGFEFSSVFQNLETRVFYGTVNGVLIIKGDNQKQLIFDFQGSKSKLDLIKDEVYDVSTKSYTGKTTSGKTEIKYETYASANGIGIKLNGQWFELTAIDGASDMVLNGIEYSYYSEKTAEYLIIRIDKELDYLDSSNKCNFLGGDK